MIENDPLYVDATRPFRRTDDGTTVLFPSTCPGTWFHAALSAPTARTADRPRLGLLRGAAGGVLIARIDLAARAATAEETDVWSAQLVRAGAAPVGITFVPLPTRRGRMTVRADELVVADLRDLQEVPIGTATTAGLVVGLSPHGVERCRAALSDGSALPVGAGFAFRYDLRVPRCRYRLTADAAAVRRVFRHHRGALAGYHGPAGGQDELDALVTALREREAVPITWQAAPDGLDGPTLATMETAILQRWIGTAADALGVPTAAAPDIVADLSVDQGGALVETAVLHREADLPRLTDLAAEHVTDSSSDGTSIPLVLDLAPDARVRHYSCRLTHRGGDGPVAATTYEAGGADGLTVVDRVRWAAGTARPDHVEVRYTITWADPRWGAADETVTLPADGPCVTLTVVPGGRIAEVSLVSDLATTPAGSLGAVSWTTELPGVDGRPARNYAGSLVAEGAGPAGALVRQVVTFPAAPDAAAAFSWTADVALPTGAVLAGGDRFTLADRSDAVVSAAALR